MQFFISDFDSKKECKARNKKRSVKWNENNETMQENENNFDTSLQFFISVFRILEEWIERNKEMKQKNGIK